MFAAKRTFGYLINRSIPALNRYTMVTSLASLAVAVVLVMGGVTYV